VTKKDYKKFAVLMGREAINASVNLCSGETVWGNILRGMEAIFEEDNPRFDESKFEDAILKQMQLEEAKNDNSKVL